MMAVCHTAVPEREGDKIIYQAASPGETQIIQWTYSVNSTNCTKFIVFEESSKIKKKPKLIPQKLIGIS